MITSSLLRLSLPLLCLALWADGTTPSAAQTREEGQRYFYDLVEKLPAAHAKEWQAAPGYAQKRDNFLNPDYTPALPERLTKRLNKEARRAARKDTKCRDMQAVESGFEGPLGLDRQVERQVLQGRIRNAWAYRIRLAGCGKAYAANFVLVQDTDEKLSHLNALPGDTLSWPSLQADALPKIALTGLRTVRQDNPSCIPARRDRVVQTKLVHKPAPAKKMFGVMLKGRWMEVWTMRICGEQLDLEVAFRADGSGGASFQARPTPGPVSQKPAP